MESSQSQMQIVSAEELMNRFRIKEDLYRYLTQQGKLLQKGSDYSIVGIFLPSMDGCKLIFLRAILSD